MRATRYIPNFFQYHFRGLISVLAITSLICAPTYAADPAAGQKVYRQNCATCHGDRGRGVIPNTPDFSRGEGLFKPDTELLRYIQQGRRAMPGFDNILTDREIIDVITHLRSLF